MAAYDWLVCYLLQSTEEKIRHLKSKGYDDFSAKNESQVFYSKSLSISFLEVTYTALLIQ